MCSNPSQTCTHRTQQEKRWAAYKTLLHAGQEHEVPIGDGCDECFQIALDILKYPKWDKFLAELNNEDQTFADLVAQIRANLRQPLSEVNWNPSKASKSTTFECTLSKSFIALDSLALKRKLNTTRLTQRATHGVPSITGPSLTEVGAEETYYLFSKSEAASSSTDRDRADTYELTVQARFAYKQSEELLQPQKMTYKEQAHNEWQHSANNDMATGTLMNIVTKKPWTMQEFTEQYKSNQRSAPSRSSTLQGGLRGRAAGEFEEDADEHSDADGAGIDLTDEVVKRTPRKLLLTLDDAAGGSSIGGDDDDDDDDLDDKGDAGDALPKGVHAKLLEVAPRPLPINPWGPIPQPGIPTDLSKSTASCRPQVVCVGGGGNRNMQLAHT